MTPTDSVRVPDEKLAFRHPMESDDVWVHSQGYAAGWNACRAEMLKILAAPAPAGAPVAWYVFADTEHWVTMDADEADRNREQGCQVQTLIFGDAAPAPAGSREVLPVEDTAHSTETSGDVDSGGFHARDSAGSDGGCSPGAKGTADRKHGNQRLVTGGLTPPSAGAPKPEQGAGLDTFADKLAQEIRRVDGNNALGAGALADALTPFILARQQSRVVDAAMVERARMAVLADAKFAGGGLTPEAMRAALRAALEGGRDGR